MSDLPLEPRVKSKRMDTLRSEGNFAWSDFSRVLSRQSTYRGENPKEQKYEIQKDDYVLKKGSTFQVTRAPSPLRPVLSEHTHTHTHTHAHAHAHVPRVLKSPYHRDQ